MAKTDTQTTTPVDPSEVAAAAVAVDPSVAVDTTTPGAEVATAPEAPVAAPAVGSKTIVLTHEFQNNTPEGIVKYGPGEVTLASDIADDLTRRQAEYSAYLTSVHVREDAIVNAGTISGNGQ